MNQKNYSSRADRNGVVIVLFAILLPVLLLLAMIAINIAHMQLTRTELKIATDAAARAGGRAWSEFNDLDQAKEFARATAELNTVSGQPLILSTSESVGEMVFGASLRDGDGRFVFEPVSEAEINNGNLASGFQVNASHDTPLLFRIEGRSSFEPSASSIATQIERDIALIIDRSASMFSFEGQITNPGQGEDYMFSVLTDLYNDPANGISHQDYLNSIADYQGLQESLDMSTRERVYTPEILALLSESGDLLTYAQTINSDYRTNIAAPRFSRWHSLELGYAAFFEVLDSTDQEELISVSSFGSDARLEAPLSSDLTTARLVADSIYPRGSTAIGKGMLEGFDSLNAPNARLGAIKTLIVLSDGLNKKGISPIAAANQIINDNPSTVINTITFGAEADFEEMTAVANIGSGKHFHAANTAQLIEVFRELAAIHRTLITD